MDEGERDFENQFKDFDQAVIKNNLQQEILKYNFKSSKHQIYTCL